MDENGMRDVFENFLVAAKQFGIFHVEFKDVDYLPVQFLVEFCRENNSLKVLDMFRVSFSGGGAAISLPLNNGPPNNSVVLTLDKLTLEDVSFYNSTAATVFANLVAHVNVSSLILGCIFACDDEEEEEEYDDVHRILSELKMPSPEQLTLHSNCRTKHFKAALDAGTTTVTDLDVAIWCDEDDIVARKLLARLIRRAVKLNTLRITFLFLDSNGPISLPPLLFQAMEVCATVTQIQVMRYNHQRDIFPDLCREVHRMQKITSRNRELDRFATNPGTYPTAELPELMRQFDNCPTGRYMMARRLPEVLSFAELCAMHLSRRRTNPPLRKNRNRKQSRKNRNRKQSRKNRNRKQSCVGGENFK